MDKIKKKNYMIILIDAKKIQHPFIIYKTFLVKQKWFTDKGFLKNSIDVIIFNGEMLKLSLEIKNKTRINCYHCISPTLKWRIY